jgi:hypothetical protein
MAFLYHNTGRWYSGYTLFIIPTLFIPTTYATDLRLSYIFNPPARHLAFNLGMRIEYVWNTMRIRSITDDKAIDFAFG